ncbi:DUF1826 domain-containing protein [Corallococcus sp. RDP092CA]|uniref:DUF1826 domain-containing protein n=1 Tax=Corallococcus sp. RDP092CA TaxID=3109369 RepID=UPI0035B43D4F
MRPALSRPSVEEAPSGAHRFVWSPEDLTDIYRDGVNLCVWRRGLDSQLSAWLMRLAEGPPLDIVARVRGDALDLRGWLPELPGGPLFDAWVEDLNFLLRLYVDLLGADALGVRLHTLARDMCPRFHVDRVGVRLLCTYAGPATEWLENAHVVRSALGVTGEVARPRAPIQSLERFDVALLKGEAWPGNTGNGAVHRSPAIAKDGTRRLLLSIEAI